MQFEEHNLLGRGIYSIPEAAHLIGMPSDRVRRWVSGYHSSTQKPHQPIVASELPEVEGKVAISFRDLLELHFIKAFLSHGMTLQKIRKAAKIASEVLGVESHPFSEHKFMTDRKNIMQTVGERMLNLNESQYEIEGVIKQSLFHGFVYTGKVAGAWKPSEKEKSVILDPKFALGKPIIENTGIRTRAIFNAWQAEGNDSKIVAQQFALTVKQVKDAVSFETKMAA
jgi:uncharacterized protein (DUF433 family)